MASQLARVRSEGFHDSHMFDMPHEPKVRLTDGFVSLRQQRAPARVAGMANPRQTRKPLPPLEARSDVMDAHEQAEAFREYARRI